MTKQTKFSIFISAFLISIFLFTNSYAGYDYGFQHIKEDGDTSNQIADGIIGETQMSFSILLKDALAEFTFYNSGPEASSITDIYFDDDVPLLIFADSAGANGNGFEYSDNDKVQFTVGANPGNLPGGNNIAFSSNYSYDSPTAPKGVNPGEWLKLYFELTTGNTFADLIAALDNDPSFRVGIHVQGFASGGSEAFVNGPGTPPGDVAPEPATMFLFGVGLIGLAGIGRKKIM